MKRTVVLAAVLLAGWWILSGKFDLLHFGTGVGTALILAVLYRSWGEATPYSPVRFLLFIPWLAGQIIQSNLRVARLVLQPGMPIRPTFIKQEPGVTGDRALTTLGVSITLTPGTLTIDAGEDEIFVHALDERSAADIRDGVMARHVRPIFGA